MRSERHYRCRGHSLPTFPEGPTYSSGDANTGRFEAAICNAAFPNTDVDRPDPRTTEDLGYAWDYIRTETLRRIGGR